MEHDVYQGKWQMQNVFLISCSSTVNIPGGINPTQSAGVRHHVSFKGTVFFGKSLNLLGGGNYPHFRCSTSHAQPRKHQCCRCQRHCIFCQTMGFFSLTWKRNHTAKLNTTSDVRLNTILTRCPGMQIPDINKVSETHPEGESLLYFLW